MTTDVHGGGVVNRPPSPLTMLLSRHTRRRSFLAGAATLGAALPSLAQIGGAMRRIGVLASNPLPHPWRLRSMPPSMPV